MPLDGSLPNAEAAGHIQATGRDADLTRPGLPKQKVVSALANS